MPENISTALLSSISFRDFFRGTPHARSRGPAPKSTASNRCDDNMYILVTETGNVK